MKVLKITRDVKDLETKELLKKDQEVERSNKRADDFISKGYAVDITPEPKKKKKVKEE